MWPFQAPRQFVIDLVETTLSSPEKWSFGRYRAEYGQLEIWTANGCSFLQPENGQLPRFNWRERRMLWRAFQTMLSKRTLAEMLT